MGDVDKRLVVVMCSLSLNAEKRTYCGSSVAKREAQNKPVRGGGDEQ